MVASADKEHSEETAAVFHAPSYLERCMGDNASAATLLCTFGNRLPLAISEIGEHLADLRDVGEVAKKGHTLKGNAGNLSAQRLYHAASRLEDALRSQHLTLVSSRLKNLQHEAERFLGALPAALDSLA